MDEINVAGIDLRVVFSEKYSIDYYQRDYSWGVKEVRDLLDDLLVKFNESYTDGDNIKSIGRYNQYFLGSFVLSKKEDVFYIIDGQQRLTTLSLILLAIYHRIQQNPEMKGEPEKFLYLDWRGEEKFHIDVEERLPIMQHILKNGSKTPQDNSIKNSPIFDNYKIIKEYFKSYFDDTKLNIFFYWLIEKVIMVRITTSSDQEAYTIFESMNDRGKTLTNLDMLKGYLLSLVHIDDRPKAIKEWNYLEEQLGKSFNDFVIKLFRAKWARTTSSHARSKKGSILKNDWTDINNHFHRFFKEYRQEDRINIRKSDDILSLLKDMKYYASYYLDLQDKKENLTPGFEEVFYLSKQEIPNIDVLFLAFIEPNDEHCDSKTKVIAKFISIKNALKTWNGINIHSDTNSRNYYIHLINRIRSQDSYEDLNVLIWFLYKEIEYQSTEGQWGTFNTLTVPTLQSNRSNYKSIKGFLANIENHIAINSNKPNAFSDYLQKGKYTIEHILASDYTNNIDIFNSKDELDIVRNQIGALGLLESKVNSSFNDLSYSKKIDGYPSHSVWLGTLSKNQYNTDLKKFNRNPALNSYIDNHDTLKGLFKPYRKFDKYAIKSRNKLVCEISKIIWDKELLLNYCYDRKNIHKFSDLEEYVDDKFNHSRLKINDEYSVGDTIIYEKTKGEVFVEAIIVSADEVKITHISKAPTKENYSTKGMEEFEDNFKEIYTEIIKEAEINENEYTWRGISSVVPLRTPVDLLHGRVYRQIKKEDMWKLKSTN